MSGAGENRWRRQGQANRQNQDRSSGTSTPSKEGLRPQAAPVMSGGAWGAKGKPSGPAPTAPAKAQTVGQHVPVCDFNANEVKEALRKRYLENTAGRPSVYHKVEGDSVPKRSSGAWGVKSNNMAHLMPSGQSFFTHLKKQLGSFEATKPAQ